MIQLIQKVHEERHIHRDIKPENFLVGNTESTKNKIFIADFGIAKEYKSSRGEHIPFCDKQRAAGSVMYASKAYHKHYEQSRRDDLESIGYVILYFLRGSLPWQRFMTWDTNVFVNKIMQEKIEITVDELCEGQPSELKEFMNYVRNLEFIARPDYKFMIGLFQGCMKRNNIDDKTPDFVWNRDQQLKEEQILKDNFFEQGSQATRVSI